MGFPRKRRIKPGTWRKKVKVRSKVYWVLCAASGMINTNLPTKNCKYLNHYRIDINDKKFEYRLHVDKQSS